MNHVDLNNPFYAKGQARMIIEHINTLPNNKCCPHYYCCYTCHLIKKYHEVGTLEYIITLVDTDYYDWHLWWDREDQKVDLKWLEKRWKCSHEDELEDAA